MKSIFSNAMQSYEHSAA